MSWDPLADQRERNFALLEQLKEREGHCNVPDSHHENGVKLGSWVVRQRNLYKKGKIDESYQQRLENLGMSWDPIADQWERTFSLLEEYKKEHGNCLVPQSYLIGDVPLGRWVSDQRYQCNKGKLSADRRGLLDSLGFIWDPFSDQWESNFALLEQFQEREGHTNVPIHHEEDGAKLGTWLNTQRQNFKKGWLDESYEQRLEAAGISWDPHADQWERNFASLEHFYESEKVISSYQCVMKKMG